MNIAETPDIVPQVLYILLLPRFVIEVVAQALIGGRRRRVSVFNTGKGTGLCVLQPAGVAG
ncbi:hypothetical protein B8W66_15375 [Mycobacterium decipiens]|uniref:Uncharacterized protein n=1 Tax=Mycobacterium decipiens TaxID=1430326 RepID=A0A1X2LSZ4_9MYCO|nr:hypothetical protein B8W66_15375 [Mycobacterium decipiens]